MPRPQGLASLVTHVFSPQVIAALTEIAICLRSATSTPEALRWLGLTLLFTWLMPVLAVLIALWLRYVDDIYIVRREQRLLPLTLAGISIVAGLATLGWLGAPREVVALVWAMVVGLIATLAITLTWKISFHAAVAAGALGILALAFGQAALLAAPLLGLIGWARVRLGAHTPAQVCAGVLIGGPIVAAAFAVAR
jgi:membrane-associated phospholipid phosphatase